MTYYINIISSVFRLEFMINRYAILVIDMLNDFINGKLRLEWSRRYS